MQVKFHPDMLEYALYVERLLSNGVEMYTLLIRGEAYLENVEAGEKKEWSDTVHFIFFNYKCYKSL